MRALVTLMLLTGALAAPVHAQNGKKQEAVERALMDKEPYQLVYDHVTARFRLHDEDGNVVRGWSEVDAGRASGVAAPVPPDRPLEIVIVNANTLVYDYTISAEIVGTQRVRACRDLGKEFVTQSILTTGQSLMGGAKLPDLGTVMKDLREVSGNETLEFGFGDDAAKTALTAGRTAVAEYGELTGFVTALAGTIDDSIMSIATLADAEPIDTLIDRVLRGIDARQPGMSDPRMVPIILARAQRDAKALLNQAKRLDSSLTEEANTLSQQLDAMTAASADEVRALQLGVMRLRRARAASTEAVMLPASELGRRVVIKLSEADDSLKHGIFPVREGEVTAHTRPTVGVMCQVSIGLSWMAPATEYNAANGTLRDASSTDDVRTAPGIFFSVGTPAFPLVALLGGIGLGKGGRPDLYLGGTVRALAPVLLNFGAVWQREMLLPVGLQPGDQLPDDFDDFDREYKPSFFAGLSFSR